MRGEMKAVKWLGFCAECWTECRPWTCPCDCHPFAELDRLRDAKILKALCDLEREVWNANAMGRVTASDEIAARLRIYLDAVYHARTEPIALAT